MAGGGAGTRYHAMSVTAVSLRSNGSGSGTADSSARGAEARRHSEVIVQAGCLQEQNKSSSFRGMGMTICALSNEWAIHCSRDELPRGWR